MNGNPDNRDYIKLGQFLRTLIIGDIHNRIALADQAVKQVPHDQVIFVGEWET
jgi:hypothetical protein